MKKKGPKTINELANKNKSEELKKQLEIEREANLKGFVADYKKIAEKYKCQFVPQITITGKEITTALNVQSLE